MTTRRVNRQMMINWIIGCCLLSLAACVSHQSSEAKVQPVAYRGQPMMHRVRRGETLSAISRRYGLSPRYLACLNAIRNPHLIQVGQQLRLPHRPRGNKAIKLSWPISRGKLTSRFGPRRSTCHDGLDIATAIGTPIRAAAGGKVIFSGRMRGYGNVVIIRHKNNYRTVYAHNQKNRVRVGQTVKRGRRIATVGKSGRTSGPHLHFELRIGKVATDPQLYLPNQPKGLYK